MTRGWGFIPFAPWSGSRRFAEVKGGTSNPAGSPRVWPVFPRGPVNREPREGEES